MDGDDDKSVWFCERVGLGWGYRPLSWQGWLVSAIFLILLVGTPNLAKLVIPLYLSANWWLAVIALMLAYTAVFLRIVYTHRG